MINKVSVGFIFLLSNYILILFFFIWVAKPMWYSDLNYTEPLHKSDLPLDYKWSEEQEARYNNYKKRIKGDSN